MTSKHYLLVYITTSSEEEARKIGEALVQERLAACINIMKGLESIYEWQGELCRAQEFVILVKTTQDQWQKLHKRVLELHSYDCPAILALPVSMGNPKFLEWIEEQCG
jgi:periplasmic divalent cation tolerance protein